MNECSVKNLVLPSYTEAVQEGWDGVAPGRISLPESPAAVGYGRPLTDRAPRCGWTPLPSRPSAAPPPAGTGSVAPRAS